MRRFEVRCLAPLLIVLFLAACQSTTTSSLDLNIDDRARILAELDLEWMKDKLVSDYQNKHGGQREFLEAEFVRAIDFLASQHAQNFSGAEIERLIRFRSDTRTQEVFQKIAAGGEAAVSSTDGVSLVAAIRETIGEPLFRRYVAFSKLMRERWQLHQKSR